MIKRIHIQVLIALLIVASFTYAENFIDIDFTRDSTEWATKFPEMKWNNTNKDYFASGIADLEIDGLLFRGAYGKFDASYAQPMDLEDGVTRHIYAFRIANTGTSYIQFPEVASAGVLTVHCASGNASESAVFHVEKLEEGVWKRLTTLASPPHGNQNRDAVLKFNVNTNAPVVLRLYGASKNLHVYTVQLQPYGPPVAGSHRVRLVALPDTQTYTADFPHIFHHQTAWCANNADSINYVIHLGDITNANSAKQWPIASAAMSLMDNLVPYTFCPGNHDIGDGAGNSGTRVTTMMNTHLPYSKYKDMKGFGGVYEANRMDNSWHTFTFDDYQFLIVSIEFAPRDGVLDWANQVIAAHPNHNVIINTHAYMYSDSKRMSDAYSHKWTPSTYGLINDSIFVDDVKVAAGANDGEQMWDKLVKLHSNIFMVLSGHVLNSGTGRLVSIGDNGNKVYQMLSNYQKGVVNTVDGGNGFLRIIDIDPEGHKFSVRSYSPYINQYKTEADQQFSHSDLELIQSEASAVHTTQSTSEFKIWSSNQTLYVVNPANEDFDIEVFNTLGSLVYAAKQVHTSLTLPLTQGYYIVKTNNLHSKNAKKVIIQ
ncbi:hypothetical protein MASR2M117_21000 [Paludibacter sp.]